MSDTDRRVNRPLLLPPAAEEGFRVSFAALLELLQGLMEKYLQFIQLQDYNFMLLHMIF